MEQITIELGPEGVGPAFVHLKRQVLHECLYRTGGNVNQAAELLNMSAASVFNLVRRYQLAAPLAKIRYEKKQKDQKDHPPKDLLLGLRLNAAIG